MSNIPVKVKITAIDKLSSTLNKVKKKFPEMDRAVKRSSTMFKVYQMRTEKFRKSLTKVGNSMKNVGSKMTMGLTAPLVGFGAYVIKASADFEKGMNKVRALAKDSQGNVLEESSEGFKKLRNLAKDLGATTKFSATEVADAMGFLGMAGLDANKIYEATPGLLDLAAASGIELGRAADIASNMMGMFGMKASEMGKISDILAATTAGANVDMNMLAESMKYAGPVAKTAGMSLQDTAAVIGLLGNVGIQGSVAGTGLKNALLALNAPGSKATKIFKELGISAKDSQGKMKPFGEVMGDFAGKISKLPKDKQLGALKAVFGKIGISSSAVLGTKALNGELKKFQGVLNNSNGAAKRMAKTMNSGASGAMVSMKSAFEGLAIAFGDSGILELFTKVVEKITGWIRGLTKLSPSILKTIAIIGAVVAALGPLIFTFGLILTALPAIITGWGILTAYMAGFGVTSLAALWPILAVVAAVAAVIALGVLIYRNWEPIKTFFVDLWKDAGEGLVMFWDMILEFKDSVISAFMSVGDFIADVFTTVWETVTGIISKIESMITFIPRKIIEGIYSMRNMLPDFVQKMVFGDAAGDKAGADQVQKNVIERNTNNKSSLNVDFSNLPNGATSSMSGPMTGIDLSMGLQGAA